MRFEFPASSIVPYRYLTIFIRLQQGMYSSIEFHPTFWTGKICHKL